MWTLSWYFLLMQHTSVSPDSKLLTVVGDDLDALLVDSQNGKVFSLMFEFMNLGEELEPWGFSGTWYISLSLCNYLGEQVHYLASWSPLIFSLECWYVYPWGAYTSPPRVKDALCSIVADALACSSYIASIMHYLSIETLGQTTSWCPLGFLLQFIGCRLSIEVPVLSMVWMWEQNSRSISNMNYFYC